MKTILILLMAFLVLSVTVNASPTFTNYQETGFYEVPQVPDIQIIEDAFIVNVGDTATLQIGANSFIKTKIEKKYKNYPTEKTYVSVHLGDIEKLQVFYNEQTRVYTMLGYSMKNMHNFS